MTEPANLTAIVVSFQAPDELRRCLRSLANVQGITLQTIVIENGSTTGNAKLVRHEFPNVQLIVNAENRGFAAAVNQGLAHAHGHVVLINPDLEVGPTTLETMVRRLDGYPDVGIVGPKLLYPDGRAQPSVKMFPRWIDLFLILSKLPNLFPKVGRKYNGLEIDYRREQIVDQVMGACFLIRRQTIDDVGRFDERFFVWFEEVDYCRRALDQGWRTLYTPLASATHVRGASFAPQPSRLKQRILRHSIRAYCQKYFGQVGEWLLLPGVVISWFSGAMMDFLRLRKPRRASDY